MHAVLGGGPLAHAVARRLVRLGPTVLGSNAVDDGPWLWRHADPATGQGVKAAIEGAGLVVIALDDDAAIDGALVVLKRAERTRLVLALPGAVELPRALSTVPDLSMVRLPAVWGPDDPWIAAWTRAVLDGRALAVPDIGAVRPLPSDDAVDAILAASGRRAARWTLAGGDPVTLTDLAATIGTVVGKPATVRRRPLWWAAARARDRAARVQAWSAAPALTRATDDWTPTRQAGRTGWVRSIDASGPAGTR